MAQKAVVLHTTKPLYSSTHPPPREEGLGHAGTSSSPSGDNIEAISMASEEQLLKLQGFSEKVVKTLVNCRKPVTRAIYSKMWKKLNSWMSSQGHATPGVHTVLEFFQEGADKGLC